MTYLVDLSVFARLGDPDVAQVVGPLVTEGLVATCAVIDLGLHTGLRDTEQLSAVSRARSVTFRWLDTQDKDLIRAVEVQKALFEQGTRFDSWTPLVVAAVAQRHGVTILHHDAVFDHIVKVTQQNAIWVIAETPHRPSVHRPSTLTESRDR